MPIGKPVGSLLAVLFSRYVNLSLVGASFISSWEKIRVL
jgi:hypothetical protein